MHIPNSIEIKKKQNKKDNLQIQCASGYYYNISEKLNYLCWFVCLISATISFMADDLVTVITMIALDVIYIILDIIVERGVKSAADLRKLFDARVLFENDGGFEKSDIRRLNEKAIRITDIYKKNYDVISKKAGGSSMQGKKDWYNLPQKIGPLFAQLECQAQNIWWNKKLFKVRMSFMIIISLIAIILGIIAFRSKLFPLLGILNAFEIILIRLVERIRKNIKYIVTSIKIDTIYDSALKQIAIDKIEDLQKLINERRSLSVFEMNFAHRLLSNKLTILYKDILKK